MDFYEQQNKARRFTAVLLFYFLLATGLIIALVNVVIYYFFIFLELYPYTPEDWFSHSGVYYISISTLLLILGGSFYRWFKLRSGGDAVARMMGAEKLNLSTGEYKERQLINVIEEMSIASGVPLPEIYVMRHEPGINAFVAGYQPTEAVMVVTQGAIDQLNREEMQGVAAHEFSHILNGDMRINIKLISVIAGIVMISVAGRMLAHGSSRSGGERGSGAIVLLGLALLVLGYLGVFFGRLIKAAVSRQREFLADAAAVQFTRNPRGIASALDTIRKSSYQSQLRHEHAEDMSHMCFSWALPHKFTAWLATHPPLLERIKRIDPAYLGRIKARDMTENIKQGTVARDTMPHEPALTAVDGLPVQSLSSGGMQPTAPNAEAIAAAPGHVEQQHIEYATGLHHSLGEQLLHSIHAHGESALVAYALLLVKSDDASALRSLESRLGAEQFEKTRMLMIEVERTGDEARIPVVDLLVPGLKAMSVEDRKGFLENCMAIIQADNRYTLHEFVLYALFEKYLIINAGDEVRVKYHSYKQVQAEIQFVLSLMVHAAADRFNDPQQVFAKTAHGFVTHEVQLLPVSAIKITELKQSLARLRLLSPLLKRSIIQACADIALYDGQLKLMESELVRVIAEYLDCPVPPLVPELGMK